MERGLRVVEVPEKWRKYELLAAYGLLDPTELRENIVRFPWTGRCELLREVREMFRRGDSIGRPGLIVVKLVPLRGVGQLPNLRIASEGDVGRLPAFFAHFDGGGIDEVWYCRTAVDESILSVAGRLAFTEGGAFTGQVVEQLWEASPRLLEDVGSPDFGYSYLRVARAGWGRRWRVEDVQPQRSRSLISLIREFEEFARELERRREPVELFCSFLESFRFGSYSLEYKFVAGKLNIIDWDTPCDTRVLRHESAT